MSAEQPPNPKNAFIILIFIIIMIIGVRIFNDAAEWSPIMVDQETGNIITSGHIGTYFWVTAEKTGAILSRDYKLNYYNVGDPHNIDWSNPDYYEVIRVNNASIWTWTSWKGYTIESRENTNPYFSASEKLFDEVMVNSGMWSRFY